MAITRWEPSSWQPFREIESLRKEMDRLFEQLMPSGDRTNGEIAFMPSAEMKETDDAIEIKLEVPGLEAKDLDIEVTENSVSIKGERKSETKTEKEGMVRSEFCYGSFERVIPLPTRIKHDQVKAEYKNGILNLNLPKSEEDRIQAVKVNIS